MITHREVNVLLVEDNEGDIWLTNEAFKECNHSFNLEVVVDGVQAVDFLNKQGEFEHVFTPDFVLLDLNLPKWNAKEVLEKVKTKDDLKHIPIIVLTTSNAENDIRDCYRLHANAFITKPVDYETFFNLIKSIEAFWVTTAKLPTKAS